MLHKNYRKNAIVWSIIMIIGIDNALSAFNYSRTNENNVKIKLISYFPNDKQNEKGIYLKNIGPICLDKSNNIIVGDWNYCTFFKFNSNGEVKDSFGKRGQGPEEFLSANKITASKEGLAVIDSGNMRISLLDVKGQIRQSFKIFKSYSDIAVSEEGIIYLTPVSQDSKLIDVLNNKGQLINSFGDKLKFNNKHIAINDVFLRINMNGEIFVAWKYFPYIRKYNKEGMLLAEYKIDDTAIKDSTKINMEASNSNIKSNKITLIGITNGFYVSSNHYYVFLYEKNKQKIVEFTNQGEKSAVYELRDNSGKEIYIGLVVIENDNNRTFFVVQGFPDARVDIFKIDGK